MIRVLDENDRYYQHDGATAAGRPGHSTLPVEARISRDPGFPGAVGSARERRTWEGSSMSEFPFHRAMSGETSSRTLLEGEGSLTPSLSPRERENSTAPSAATPEAEADNLLEGSAEIVAHTIEIRCSDCAGTGRCRVNLQPGPHGGLTYLDCGECLRCGGTGRVTVAGTADSIAMREARHEEIRVAMARQHAEAAWSGSTARWRTAGEDRLAGDEADRLIAAVG